MLGHIDVKLIGGTSADEIIRRYRFDYRHGNVQAEPEHFGKTLLEHITMLGLNAAHELYRHTFDYFDAEKDAASRPVLFDAQKTWGGTAASRRIEPDRRRHGRGQRVGGDWTRTLLADGQRRRFQRRRRGQTQRARTHRRRSHRSHQRSEFRCVRISRPQPIAVPVATGGLSPLRALVNGPRSGELGHTDRSGWTVEGNLNLGGIFGTSIGYSRTNTNDTRVAADMDGDGFIDWVSIEDGMVSVRRGYG